MNNFFRALRKASKHWPLILAATGCSLVVATLWGANIGAFYPILEVTLRGESIQDWVDSETQNCQRQIQELQAQLERIQALNNDQSASEDSASEGATKQTESVGEGPQQEIALRPDLPQDPLAIEQQLNLLEPKLLGYQEMQAWAVYAPKSPFQTIAWIVVALIVSTMVKHVCLIANEYLVGRVAMDVSRDLRTRIFDKAMSMDRAGYASFGTGGFTANITHSTEMLANGLMNVFGAAIREPLKIIACLVGAGLICWRLLLLSVVIAPVVGWLLVAVTKRLKAVSQSILSKANSFHHVMHESLGNIQTVQAYRMEGYESDRFGEATMMMRNFGLKFVFYSSLSKPIVELLGVGMLGTTIVGGAYIVLNKETHILGIPICDEPLSQAKLLVFFGMLIGISDPLRKLSAVYSSVYTGSIAATGIYNLLDRKDLVRDPANPVPMPNRHQRVALDGVTFGYDPDAPILQDVSLEIPYGETVAIVGHNGSGKSTLINLLCRFYDPQIGSMKMDDVDFRQLAVDDVRRRIALVNQHTELFNNTVEFNIRYGKMEASPEEVEAAAREAHAHEFITSALSDGYATTVGQNGHKLSGGQRQRIALARALLCDPEILILDEATSQIDMQSEQLIRESLAKHKGERTMIIITHREKLLELADRIYEVKDGKLHAMNHVANHPSAAA